MGLYHEKRAWFKNGIIYNIDNNTPIEAHLTLYLSKKKFNFDIHYPILKKIFDELKLINHIWPDRYNDKGEALSYTIIVTKSLPFNKAEVLAISYRKRLNRIIRSVIYYNNKDIDFLIKYVNHNILKDFKYYGG